MDTKKNKPKEKRRSNEKRKEKSRDAARCRRSRETDIFSDLAAVLPVTSEQAAHLDKASIMRLAIAYLKARSLMNAIPGSPKKAEPAFETDDIFLKALDGFVLILSSNGDIIYLSQNVSDYLGISQMDMMGQSVYEYSHPCDHDEIRDCFSAKQNNNNENQSCNFFLRFKCTLTSKGRKVNLKSASYKVINCTGRLITNDDAIMSSSNMNSEDETDKESALSMIIVGCPVPHPSNIEVPLGRHTFLSKHNLNMKFTYADEKLTEFLGWDSSELVGQSVYDFYHALDNNNLEKAYKSLFHKGQCETIAYRFLSKEGGYAWVITQATLIRCSKQHKPLSVVCVNYILSGIECKNEVYSSRQLEASKTSCTKSGQSLERTKANKIVLSCKTVVPIAVSEAKSVTAPSFRLCDKKKVEKIALPDITAIVLEPNINQQVNESNQSTPKCLESYNKNASKNVFPQNESGQMGCDSETSVSAECIDNSLNYLNCGLLDQELLIPSDFDITPPAETNTASIFAPRTEDMNKGFLTFSEDQPGLTMLKDEPEDLTHLAPTAGDVCVPLDTPFLTDMLDDFILGNETICPLLSPDIPPEVSMPSNDLTDSSAIKDTDSNIQESQPTCNKMTPSYSDSLPDYETKDPFIYRDSTSRSSINTDLSSPSFSKNSESIDSLYSPTRSFGGCGDSSGGANLSEDEMLMLSISDVIDDDVNLRAPYISMDDNENNDALQLLISDDMVMWGPTQSAKRYKWSNETSADTISNTINLYKNETIKSKSHDARGETIVNTAHVLAQNSSQLVAGKLNGLPIMSSTNVNERPQKRMHYSSDRPVGNGKKRLKSENVKSSNRGSSQLLQQLVSQQTSVKNCWIQSPEADALLGRPLDGQLELDDNNCVIQVAHELVYGKKGEGDVGDGGGGGGGGEDSACVGVNHLKADIAFERITSRAPTAMAMKTTAVMNTDPGELIENRQSNSVLMNLLVSGCDGLQMPSRPMTVSSPHYVEHNATFAPLDEWTQNSYNTIRKHHPAARKDLLRTLHCYDNEFF